MFQKQFTIRFSETDLEGHLTIPALINYVQDVIIMDSDASAARAHAVDDATLGWMVTYWQLDIHRLPVRGEDVDIGTFIHRLTKAQVNRSFYVKTPAGECLAEGYSVWLLWDLVRQKMMRVPEAYLSAVDVHAPLPIVYTKRHIDFPDDLVWTTLEETQVRWDQIDTNHHMNNVEYLKMIQSAFRSAAEAVEPAQFLIEYRKQAFLDDAISVRAARQANRVYLALVGDGESVLSRAAITLKE